MVEAEGQLGCAWGCKAQVGTWEGLTEGCPGPRAPDGGKRRDRRDGGRAVQTGPGRLRESEGGAPKECRRKMMPKGDLGARGGGFGG